MQTNLVDLKIARPEGDAASEAMTAMTYAESFAIVSSSDSIKAQEARARINTKIKTLTEARLAQTRPIDEAKKKIMEWWAKPIAVLEQAKKLFDQKILAYDQEQERIRKEAQRKAEAEAATERKRLQDIADAALRKANEEAAAKRKAAEEAAAAGRAEESAKLKAQAARVEEKAADKAENFQNRAASVVAPIIESESTKAAGSSFRDNWKWRLKDVKKIKPEYTKTVPNEEVIGALVKSMKLEAVALIGEGSIEVFNDRGLASRRA